jgi:hypothetical protein
MHMRGGSRFFAGCMLLALGCLAVLIQGMTGSVGNVVLGGLALAFGVGAFVSHGGPVVTTVGLVNFAFALFVGYAGIEAARNPASKAAPEYLSAALLAALATQVLVTLLAWNRASPGHLKPTRLSASDASFFTSVGLVTLAALLAVRGAGVTGLFLEGGAFMAVVVLSIGVLFRPRLVVGLLLVLLIAFAVYVEVFHGGTGRLRLVALACAMAILTTARFPRWELKGAIVVGTPMAVGWLARERLELQESLRIGASAGNSGLESMLSPIVTFARVIEAQVEQDFPLAYGQTFATLPFAVLPHRLTPDWAPGPLGYELVRITSPDRYGSGYSVASTIYGEWWFNFSLLGCALAVPALVWALTFLDRRIRRAFVDLENGRRAGLRLALYAALCGSIADIVWSGTHTWGARSLARLPLLLSMWPLAKGSSEEDSTLASSMARDQISAHRSSRTDSLSASTSDRRS